LSVRSEIDRRNVTSVSSTDQGGEKRQVAVGLLQILSKAYASRIYRESIRVYVQNIEFSDFQASS
jgi:hypothetical protein